MNLILQLFPKVLSREFQVGKLSSMLKDSAMHSCRAKKAARMIAKEEETRRILEEDDTKPFVVKYSRKLSRAITHGVDVDIHEVR